MKTYTARARRWEHGWELHVDGVGVTQVRLLQNAEQQVRDLIETFTGKSAGHARVEIELELGTLEGEIQEARQLTAEALDLQKQAAARNRAVVARLREAHLSVTDIATVLGVSRGRVSQLLAGS